jgi:TonB family protein
VWIDEHGRVTHVESVRPNSLLDATAMAAVRQWTFIPAILHDKPVAVVQTVAVRLDER